MGAKGVATGVAATGVKATPPPPSPPPPSPLPLSPPPPSLPSPSPPPPSPPPPSPALPPAAPPKLPPSPPPASPLPPLAPGELLQPVVVLSLFVRRTEQAFDTNVFADRLAMALNYSVAASEVRVDVQRLPYVCLSEVSVRTTFELQ